jgi:hypothetical protein
MLLQSKTPKKDGKEHRYWGVVENHRLDFIALAARKAGRRKQPRRLPEGLKP